MDQINIDQIPFTAENVEKVSQHLNAYLIVTYK